MIELSYSPEREQWKIMESPGIHNTSGTDLKKTGIVVTFSTPKAIDHGKAV
jgi:hypothetical protein